ncbi:MAG: ACT domain-containing protein, partial [Akkermansiaceae bacterium]|nr:ACT domain-containing protein [Armatimonadota bacterium]
TLSPERVAICQMPPQTPPEWVWRGAFCSVTRTVTELSIVAEEAHVPPEAKCDRGWRVLSVEGTLDLNMTGVLASLAEPLAGAGINIFSISTYDTDHILVQEPKLADAIAALRMAGHHVL